MTGKAFTRAVSPRLAACALTHVEREFISFATARVQHDAYERALRATGLDVIRLAPLANHPDGVFVEDTALLLDGHAVITRPGAPSRAGEVQSTATGLAPHFDVHRITRGHLDGGDVLRMGKKLYVGLSTRTNSAGAAELKNVAGKLGFDVVPAQLRHCLHLKTAATLAGHDAAGRLTLLYDGDAVDPTQFAGVDVIAVEKNERGAANVLHAGGRVIMAAGNPNTAMRLRERGFDVDELDVSELQKAEAGVTCMSLVSEDSAHS